VVIGKIAFEFSIYLSEVIDIEQEGPGIRSGSENRDHAAACAC
jgi:hypothetical protein